MMTKSIRYLPPNLNQENMHFFQHQINGNYYIILKFNNLKKGFQLSNQSYYK